MICTGQEIYSADEIKRDEGGGACGRYGRGERLYIYCCGRYGRGERLYIYCCGQLR